MEAKFNNTQNDSLSNKLGANSKEYLIAQFYNDHSAALLFLAIRILDRRDLAFEVVSDVIWKLLSMPIEQFSKISCLNSYSYSIVRRDAMKLKSKRLKLLRLIEFDSKWTEAEDNFLKEIFKRINIELRVKKALSILKKKSQSLHLILHLYYFEGLTHKEIASYIKISEGNSRTRLNRARKEFAKIYMNLPPDDNPFGNIDGGNNNIPPIGGSFSKFNNLPMGQKKNKINNNNLSKITSNKDSIFKKEVLDGYRILSEKYNNDKELRAFLNNSKIELWNRFFHSSSYLNIKKVENEDCVLLHTIPDLHPSIFQPNEQKLGLNKDNHLKRGLHNYNESEQFRQDEEAFHEHKPEVLYDNKSEDSEEKIGLTSEEVKKRNILITNILEANAASMDMLDYKFFGNDEISKEEARSSFIHKALIEKSIPHLNGWIEKGKGYFYRAYRNSHIDYLKKYREKNHFFQEIIDKQEFAATSVEESITLQEEEKFLKNCIWLVKNQFNEKYANIFSMKYNCIKNSIIANHLGMTTNAVNIALSRIKLFLYNQNNLKH